MAADKRASEAEQKLAYFEGRARHFEYHARSNAKKLKNRDMYASQKAAYPTKCCYTSDKTHIYYHPDNHWHSRLISHYTQNQTLKQTVQIKKKFKKIYI